MVSRTEPLRSTDGRLLPHLRPLRNLSPCKTTTKAVTTISTSTDDCDITPRGTSATAHKRHRCPCPCPPPFCCDLLALSLSSRNTIDTTLASSPGATSLSSGTAEQRRLEFGNPCALFSRRKIPQALIEPRSKQPHASSERLSLSPRSAAVLDYLSNPFELCKTSFFSMTEHYYYTSPFNPKRHHHQANPSDECRATTRRELERMNVGRRSIAIRSLPVCTIARGNPSPRTRPKGTVPFVLEPIILFPLLIPSAFVRSEPSLQHPTLWTMDERPSRTLPALVVLLDR